MFTKKSEKQHYLGGKGVALIKLKHDTREHVQICKNFDRMLKLKN